MFKNLFAIPHSFLRFMVVRALLFFTLFFGLGLFTLLMAFFVMFLQWHWRPELILAVCLSPWFIAIIILAIATYRCSADLQYKKKNWFSLEGLDTSGLFFQVASVVSMLTRKK